MLNRFRVIAVLVLAAVASGASEPAADVTSPPPAEAFIVVPLRVHVLTSTDVPEIDCQLTDADVERVIAKMNRVWSVAGIYFGVESVVREPAAKVDQFKRIREELGGAPLGLFRILRPEGSRAFDGLHVYYVHKLPVNGVYMGEDYSFVQETAKLREVEGGIDEPVPRVTGHELGHALGLPHRQNRTNLMASGTTGTLLNEAEVKVAREKALKTKGAMRYDECVKKAEGDERATRWVEEIRCGAGFQPAVTGEEEQAGSLHHNGEKGQAGSLHHNGEEGQAGSLHHN